MFVASVDAAGTDAEISPSKAFLFRVAKAIGRENEYFKAFVYSEELVRMTFRRLKVPIYRVWRLLMQLQQSESGVIISYSFRQMNTEDLLSALFDNVHI
jgi:hypothetical protein